MDTHQPRGASYRVQRRVAGYHDQRMDGMSDLLLRARGTSVFDVGCNRGLVGFEFACAGATVVHGCDIWPEGVNTARELFADLRSVDARFEVCDLTKGVDGLRPFASERYDVTVCLATYHKLKRLMPAAELSGLMQYMGRWTKGFFAWRGTSDKPGENDIEMAQLDVDLGKSGLVRVHTSRLSAELGVCAVWAR